MHCKAAARIALGLLLVVACIPASAAAGTLEGGFANPPDAAKPWVYWYWISDSISKEGITRDLEAMARVGIGEALIGNIFLDDIPGGSVKVLSEEWWKLIEHAIREGGRVGVGIGIFNCPGWSQSGGPWIEPAQAMRYLVSSEVRVTGPIQFEGKLPIPKEPFQDVAITAFPAPRADGESLGATAARVSSTPPAPGAERLLDGALDTEFAFPRNAGHGASAFTIDIELPQAACARSLALYPTKSPWAGACELLAAGNDGAFARVRTFRFDRSNMAVNVGPMPQGPVAVSFPATTAARWRLVFSGVSPQGALAEIRLSGAARLEHFVEKQLGKMHPTPLPLWDTYLWPAQAEPEARGFAIAAGTIQDLTQALAPDGTLRWDVPAGQWIILRTGMTPTGTRNAPASPEGQGLEVDKMHRGAAERHFNAFIGKVLARMPAAERKAFTRVVADSYEMGSQNWTDGFAWAFNARYGYDPLPWLPVLTGRLVDSADKSERFLWDLRRLVADRIAREYVGGLRDLCRPHGLQLWLENYGHWGFPAEFLQYGGQSDRIGGEFWVTGDLGSIECRAASSAANTYGKPFVSAEAFTGGPAFQNAPAALKARGDWAFCEGINHFVLHVYIHQPWEDRVPGMNAWFGTEFNRHNTWFERSKTWIEYLRRSCHLLQQGTRVADVAYFIGEDAPKMTGVRRPELPPGRDFDYINAEVLLDGLLVRDGRFALRHGTTYRALVLPEQQTMRPEVLRKILALVREGGTVVGLPPSRSPSMQGYPECDAAVRALAAELWGSAAAGTSGERRVGKGRVVWGTTLDRVLADEGPDFTSGKPLRFTHRAADGADIYFVANGTPEDVATTCAFRVAGKAPELWWPDSGRIERPAVYDEHAGAVCLPLCLGPHGSVFVVFRSPAASKGRRIAAVACNGEKLLDTVPPALRTEPSAGKDAPANDFTLAFWARPAADTTLFAETNEGVRGLAEARNDAVFPTHGDSFGTGNRAGCGLAVGRNGVCVFEHGANYFAPVLVHAVAVADWTHVAVVYRNAQPSLFLNGVLVRKGMASTHTVHPGSGGGGAPFRGQLGGVETIPRALADAEVAALAGTMPRPGSSPAAAAVKLTHGADGGIEAEFGRPGNYELTLAGGAAMDFVVPVLPPLELAGPWEVEFGVPGSSAKKIVMDRLEDWTARPEEEIKHYSGTATYTKTFRIEALGGGVRYHLDLGSVRDIATIRVNGKEQATLWNAPWRIDVTGLLVQGTNTLSIDVTNVWNNRLVGDLALPAEKRRTFLAAPTVGANTPLLPAGLLGPVVIRTLVIERVN